MNVLSLFSGIGGLDLAAQWAGMRTVMFCETDDYCRRILRKHWPDVPIHGDVRTLTARAISERVDLVTGGFPCQPHSLAGRRKGSGDERDLWPEFARILREVRPRWVVAENVLGILSVDAGRFFGRVLGELAGMGYGVAWMCYGASDVGATHRRERVFIVADAASSRRIAGECCASESFRHKARRAELERSRCDVADADGAGQQELCGSGANGELARRGMFGNDGWWRVEPDVGRVANGISSRVDRLRALGNAVVPQQAYPIFKAIMEEAA